LQRVCALRSFPFLALLSASHAGRGAAVAAVPLLLIICHVTGLP
jgi:hypothetical protein